MIAVDPTVLLLLLGGFILGVAGGFFMLAVEIARRLGWL